jgi:hypothetical protein
MNEFDGYGNGDNLLDAIIGCRPFCVQSNTDVYGKDSSVGVGCGGSNGYGFYDSSGYGENPGKTRGVEETIGWDYNLSKSDRYEGF